MKQQKLMPFMPSGWRVLRTGPKFGLQAGGILPSRHYVVTTFLQKKNIFRVSKISRQIQH